MRKPGASYKNGSGCTFTVWAPLKKSMKLRLVFPSEEFHDMQKNDDGYFTLFLEHVRAGYRYFYQDEKGRDLPDPASAFQPDGVHGPSEITDHEKFEWTDQLFRQYPLEEMIIYEMHTGTFTTEGTFEAAIERLDDLKETGINAIEVMPIAQFPGKRNWGYDGAYPYAVQNSYGGPDGFRKFVNACHEKKIAVILDVVYNHLGPEGNYLGAFGPYFTDQYRTPWGDAINFDHEWSEGVRDYFTGNIGHWCVNYHVDGLRLDAVHMIFDRGARHILREMNDEADAMLPRHGRNLFMIAESDLNDPIMITDGRYGYGFDMQWIDDFHHSLYVVLHEAGKERYEDFGEISQLAKAINDGFVHSGSYVKFRKRRYGASSSGIGGNRFVAFIQNHDQTGNRPDGGRLSHLVDHRRRKLAAAALLLSPYIPMIFMGEEYAEQAPFYYFVDHSDPKLIKAVQRGRKEEFKNFKHSSDLRDPGDVETFRSSVLNWGLRNQGDSAVLLAWYKELIRIRKSYEVMRNYEKSGIFAFPQGKKGLIMQRYDTIGELKMICIFNFGEDKLQCELPGNISGWKVVLDSTLSQWSAKEENEMPCSVSTEAGRCELPPLSIITLAGSGEPLN